jgi:transposase-like protein
VVRFTPPLADAARPCRHAVGSRWQVDETYIKVGGQWRYVYRAVAQFGQVIDVFVAPRRDVTAARHFFQQAITSTKSRRQRSSPTRRRPTPSCSTTCSPACGTTPRGPILIGHAEQR